MLKSLFFSTFSPALQWLFVVLQFWERGVILHIVTHLFPIHHFLVRSIVKYLGPVQLTRISKATVCRLFSSAWAERSAYFRAGVGSILCGMVETAIKGSICTWVTTFLNGDRDYCKDYCRMWLASHATFGRKQLSLAYKNFSSSLLLPQCFKLEKQAVEWSLNSPSISIRPAIKFFLAVVEEIGLDGVDFLSSKSTPLWRFPLWLGNTGHRLLMRVASGHGHMDHLMVFSWAEFMILNTAALIRFSRRSPAECYMRTGNL